MPSNHQYITSFGVIRTKRIFSLFQCAACLPASLIIHVPISELHAQWHLSISLNSQRFLQFHPTVMLVAYINSCFILMRKTSFLFIFLAESFKIIVRPRLQKLFSHRKNRLLGCVVKGHQRSYMNCSVYCRTDWNLRSICVFMKIKKSGQTFYFKTR